MSRKKGSRYERKLVSAFDSIGDDDDTAVSDEWFVSKEAASGSATERDLPDVTAARNGVVWVMELKSVDVNKNTKIWVSEEKVDGLVWLATNLGGEPRLVARWINAQDTTFYAYHPEELRRTEAGSYVLDFEDRDAGTVFPPTPHGD